MPFSRSGCGRHPGVVPAAEDEEGPELLSVVAPPGEVIIEQLPDGLWPEEPIVFDPVRMQGLQQWLLERTQKPFRQGDAEAFLAAVEDVRRQAVAHGVLEQKLGAQAAKFE